MCWLPPECPILSVFGRAANVRTERGQRGKKTKKQLVAGQIQPRIATNTMRMPRWAQPDMFLALSLVSLFELLRPWKLTCTLVSSASRAQTHQVGGCPRVTAFGIVQENTMLELFPAINQAPSLDFIFFFARSVGYRQRYWVSSPSTHPSLTSPHSTWSGKPNQNRLFPLCGRHIDTLKSGELKLAVWARWEIHSPILSPF